MTVAPPPADRPPAPDAAALANAPTVAAAEWDDLIASLFDEPHRFDFFQAVRLLERDGCGLPDPVGIGEDGPPSREPVRFAAMPTMQFPPGMIIDLLRQADYDDGPESAEMKVALFGLLGPLGALPRHYTEQAADRAKGLKDETLPRFLDLVQHRLSSLMYRASVRSRVGLSAERAAVLASRSRRAPPSRVVEALLAVVGVAIDGPVGRASKGSRIPEQALLYYAGRLHQENASAEAVRAVLSDHFGLPVRVSQWQGRWIRLPAASRTEMTPRGNCALGVSTVAGTRVWDQTSLYRLRIGPLDRVQFDSFLPGRSRMAELGEWINRLVGPDLDVEVQLVLKAEHVPRSRFGPSEPIELGRASWTKSTPFEQDAEDVVIRLFSDQSL